MEEEEEEEEEEEISSWRSITASLRVTRRTLLPEGEGERGKKGERGREREGGEGRGREGGEEDKLNIIHTVG